MRQGGGVIGAMLLATVLGACSPAARSSSARSTTTTHPASTTTTVSTSDTSLNPPSSVFYLQPSADTSTLISYDWSGHQVGSVHTAIPIPCCALSQSPDGSRLFYGANILDGQGRLVATLTNNQSSVMWADDNRHWCRESNEDPSQPFAGRGVLDIVGPEASNVRRIAEVGRYGPHGAPSLVACDLGTHTAVVTDSELGMVVGVDLVNLSTGQVTSALPNGPTDPCSRPLVASADGSMVAGNLLPVQGQPVPGAPGGIVCSLQTHQIVSHFDGQAETLSRTGRLVVTLVTSPDGYTLQVLDLHTHHILWRGPTVPRTPPWVAAFDEPGGDGLVLTVTANPSLGTGAADGWLVRPGTSPVHLASNVSQGVE